jgi:ubiquinone/menaquinone biosynthesis C-methylase UbiE
MDPFQQVRQWDERTALGWASGLDFRAADPQQVALRDGVLAAAALAPGQVAVEVGCGTGPLLAGLAAAVGPAGAVLGIEPQRTLARLAADRTAAGTEGTDGTTGRVGVALGIGDRLPVLSGVADAVVAQTVLLHVPEPALTATLAEMVRIARPGGRVISVDQDMDGWLIDHPDRETTSRLLRLNTIHRYGDGWAGRTLARRFRAAGLVDVEVVAHTHVDTAKDSHLHGNALRMLGSLRDAGLVDAADADRWAAELDAQPTFFSALTYYRCTGTVRTG